MIGIRLIDEQIVRMTNNNNNNDQNSIILIYQNLMDSFLKERLGIQLLCDHYVALSKQERKVGRGSSSSSSGSSLRGVISGGVSVDCNFIDVVSDSILEAKMLCDANLGIAPEVYVVFDRKNSDNGDIIDLRHGIIDDVRIPITLIRPWIQHILVEVLKNAMSSNVEKFLLEEESSSNTMATTNLPPNIYIRIHDSNDNLTCEILDQGVGLDYDDHSEKAFEFAFSTSHQRWDRLDEQQSYAMVRSPLGSLGVGLTLSRMMIEMFGGELRLSPRSSGLTLGLDASRKEHLVLESGCTATVILNRDSNLQEWSLAK